MDLKQIEEEIKSVLPPACSLVKVELEGPQIVLYLKNIRAFYEDENLITKIAAKVRKKVLLRVDADSLIPPSKAEAKIKELIPLDAGVQKIVFNPVFNEVQIEALKPGLVIGKRGFVLKNIILETGWSPQVLRSPTSPSQVETAIRSALFKSSADRKKFLNGLGKKLVDTSGARCDWVKLTMLGAAKEVGRSCLLLQTPKSNILLDCGINPDTSDSTRAYPYLNAMNLALEQIDAVIVSHAHLDHSGFVPYLYAYGYKGPVYCTPPTRDLMVLLQQDCLNVMNSEIGKAPYAEKDIKTQLNHIIVRDYGEVTDVTPEVRFTFHNAGHILGSSQVHLHIGEGLHNLVYTGDIKFGKIALHDPADIRFPRVETLVMESTYGARDDMLPRYDECQRRLVDVVQDTIKKRGKVLIPVFSVGRAQEIQLTLEPFLTELNVPVYLDGMSREASAIYTVYPEYLRRNVRRRILQNNSPFEHEMFKNVVSKERQEIVENEEPCVILAPSGMLSGGTSVEFLKSMATDPANTLVFVGYQSSMSLGRRIQAGAKEIPLLNSRSKLDSLKINMQIHTVDGFSGHSDRSQLLAFAKNIRPKPSRVLCIHGDEGKTEMLSRTLNKMLHIETRAPMNLDSMRLV
ncbi:MAG: beta-CASP ribonuclease aCPSF1 [Candidatus Micrarchaeota archaeon]